jgi:hypothetical protein
MSVFARAELVHQLVRIELQDVAVGQKVLWECVVFVEEWWCWGIIWLDSGVALFVCE